MLKKTMTYKDYDGNERTEDFYFNLTKAELVELQLSENGGFDKLLKRLMDSQDNKEIIQVFKKMIILSYGIKSLDGKTFVKSPEITREFMQTEAYSDLFMELASNQEAAAAFINGVVPQDVAEAARNVPTSVPDKSNE